MNELKSIEPMILTLRGQKIVLDTDLAEAYGVETKRLNEQVKRNIDRFPEDFMFCLTQAGKTERIAICDPLQRVKVSPQHPFVFTEHGAMMVDESRTGFQPVSDEKCYAEKTGWKPVLR